MRCVAFWKRRNKGCDCSAITDPAEFVWWKKTKQNFDADEMENQEPLWPKGLHILRTKSFIAYCS